jgi:branched-chain amino acid transport system permease protein
MKLLSRNTRMTIRYEDDLRLFRSHTARVVALIALAAAVIVPLSLGDFPLSVLCYAGIATIGAIGLNLLVGYTGQVSLGHAFFLGAGAYTTAYLGRTLGLPLPLWLAASAIVGAAIGALIGPFALRLRGNYLVIVSLGLLMVGQHVFENWDAVTGGLTGVPVRARAAIGPLDFAALGLGSLHLTRNQGYFYLIWIVAGLLLLGAKNIVRTRPGRALQAIRDKDLAAEVLGISVFKYKVAAFALSSAYAAMAGALYASYARYISPLDWSLFLSIQYIAMIIVGGAGTMLGSVLGALFLTLVPRLVETLSGFLPFVSRSAGSAGGITVFGLNQLLFGVLIIVFLVFEPRGLAEIWRRTKLYFTMWPFSY